MNSTRRLLKNTPKNSKGGRGDNGDNNMSLTGLLNESKSSGSATLILNDGGGGDEFFRHKREILVHLHNRKYCGANPGVCLSFRLCRWKGAEERKQRRSGGGHPPQIRSTKTMYNKKLHEN